MDRVSLRRLPHLRPPCLAGMADLHQALQQLAHLEALAVGHLEQLQLAHLEALAAGHLEQLHLLRQLPSTPSRHQTPHHVVERSEHSGLTCFGDCRARGRYGSLRATSAPQPKQYPEEPRQSYLA